MNALAFSFADEVLETETLKALRAGLEELVTAPGMHEDPAFALKAFDEMAVYPAGIQYRDRACRVLQDLRRFNVTEIDYLLRILGFW